MVFVLKWRSQEGKMHLNIKSFKTGERLWYKEHSLRVKYAIFASSSIKWTCKKIRPTLKLVQHGRTIQPNLLQFRLVPLVVHCNALKTYFNYIMVFTNIYIQLYFTGSSCLWFNSTFYSTRTMLKCVFSVCTFILMIFLEMFPLAIHC